MPGSTPATVLVVLAIGTPSMVRLALVPPLVVKVGSPADGVIVSVPGRPELLLTMARREPLASGITLAVTPMLLVLLLACPKPASVLSVLLMVIGTAGFVPT